MNLENTLTEIESNKPEVGIGTAAATAGLLAASLVMKVANKSKLDALQAECEKAKNKFEYLLDEDQKAFKEYMAAWKSKDASAIQYALRYATETPLMMAETAYKIMELAETALNDGKKSLALEAYGAAYIGKASLECALEVVEMNMQDLEDQVYISQATKTKNDLHYNGRNKLKHMQKIGNFHKYQ